MRRAIIGRLWILLAAAGLAAGQVDQELPDCTSPQSVNDPRCRLSPATDSTEGQPRMTNSRIPVIRDSGVLPGTSDRAGRTLPREEKPEDLEPRRERAEPPTEFQKFVQQTTGAFVPVFGQKLFENAPTTFAPADRIPVTPEYTLGPGDQLLVRAWGAIDLSLSPVVDRSGAIYIPRVGEINMAGIRFVQAQDYLKTAISRIYRNFDLSVSMGQLRSMQVLVTGQARRPGAYTISSLSTLVNAVFASGGPNTHGSMRQIRLMRGGHEAGEFDLYDLLLQGDASHDQRLLAGDVIYIPPAGPQVALTGSVNTPGIYELKGEVGLREALVLAGGLTPVAARRHATIQRVGSASSRILDAPLEPDAPAGATLQNGDIVSVFSIVPRLEETVTLRGNVADPIRMPWHAGMRVRDLIPDRRALLSREYWRERDRLKPERLETRRPPDAEPPQSPQRRPEPDEIDGEMVPTVRRVAAGLPAPAERTPASKGTPASIAAAPREPRLAENRVERNPLEVNWSYAVIERLNADDLRTTLLSFNLGKAIIDGDESENLPLEPGDVVMVFSISDLKLPQAQQTRYVRLEGEFASAGVYSVRPGESLRTLVMRAGGLTPQAYLFGSELLRESTRMEQQQRLDEFADSLERQTASSAANIRGTVLSPEEAAAANSEISAQRELVEKLHQVRAQGRVVLDLQPRAAGAAALPELQLEDGDVFTVPSRPSFVNVVGSVQSSTSFLWSQTKHLGEYLRAAGGPSRSADSRHLFLIRADGSVVSRTFATGVVTKRFSNAALNPGDTVVVPEQINKTSFLKGLKDWSLIFGQLGLGVAAINVLR